MTKILFQRRNNGLHTRGTKFLKRFLTFCRAPELDIQIHEHGNGTFVRVAPLSKTSLIISVDIVQGLIDNIGFTSPEKVGYATESIWVVWDRSCANPSNRSQDARTERGGMESCHGVRRTRCYFVLDRGGSEKTVNHLWIEILDRQRHVKCTKKCEREKGKVRADRGIDVWE